MRALQRARPWGGVSLVIPFLAALCAVRVAGLSPLDAFDVATHVRQGSARARPLSPSASLSALQTSPAPPSSSPSPLASAASLTPAATSSRPSPTSLPSQQPLAPTRASALPAGRLLVLRSIHYGRYSNNLIALTEALGLAAASGRSLLSPRFDRCAEPLDELFDMTAMEVAVAEGNASGNPALPPQLFLLQPPQEGGVGSSLVGACGETGVYIPLRDEVAGKASHTWRGVAWRALHELPAFDPLAAGLPPERVAAALPRANLTRTHPYGGEGSLFCPGIARYGLPELLVDSWLPQRLSAAPLSAERCLLIGNPFLSLNWATLPRGAFERAARGVARPAARIDAALDRWLAARGLTQRDLEQGLGVHLRLKDIGNERAWCEHDPRGFVATLQWALAAAAAAGAAARGPLAPPPLAFIATDDAGSPCAALVRGAFPAALDLVSGDSQLGGCAEVAWVQAALARTAFFVGNFYSTFSGVVHMARVLRFGRAVNTSVWVE